MNSPYKSKFKVSQQFKGSSHDGLDLVGIDDKKIYSTVDGVVERAGWENPLNYKQGFGKYVRIKQNGSEDRYYFGHLSELYVKVGDKVKAGHLIGIEGSTGKSTGSHCHYCIRGSASRSKIRDVCAISGIPNKLGTYNYTPEVQKKTVSEVAQEVLNGKWGNGEERKKKLTAAGYDYTAVQKEVNRLASKSSVPTKKTNEQIAKEVIKGLWGVGADRKRKLADAGYNYYAIQKLVNQMLK